MNHTDPIADMIVRIKNTIGVEKKELSLPLSKIKLEIVKILKNEGYITNYKVDKAKFPAQLVIELKYAGKKQNAIEGMKRVSKPGHRIYADNGNLPKVLDGLGIAVISTSQGLMTGRQCREKNVGGEVLLSVW